MNEIKKYFFLIGSFVFSLLFPFFTLYSDANITGKVIDSTSAQILQGVRIQLLDFSDERVVEETSTDVRGMYEFRMIPSGQYKLQAECVGYVPVSVNPTAITLANSPIRANFSLGIPGGIIGRVTDSVTNLPIPNANIDVMRGNNIIVSALTDQNGNYQINDLAPRPYIVRVRMTYFQSSMQLAVPISNGILTLDFSLQCPPGKLTGQIVNSVTGQPISDATIDVYENGFVIDSVQSNEDGSYLITEIAPGTYEIKVKAQRYGSYSEKIALATNQTLTTHFNLDGLGVIEGQVMHNLSGRPIVRASVGVWQNGELLASTHTDDNGYFHVEALRDCQVVVQALSMRDMEQEVRVLPSQTTSLNFVLESREPTPPKRVIVVVSYKKEGKKTIRTHTVKWRESADPNVVTYRIYRDGKKIAEVSAQESFYYRDKGRTNKDKRYEVTAVNQYGQESLPRADEGIEK